MVVILSSLSRDDSLPGTQAAHCLWVDADRGGGGGGRRMEVDPLVEAAD